MATIPIMPTFGANKVIKTADFNQLRDGVNFITSPPNLLARQAIGGTSVQSNAWTQVSWDTIEVDSDGGMSGNVYFCQTPGWFTVNASVTWPWNNPSVGNRGLRVSVNNVPQAGMSLIPASASIVTATMYSRAVYLNKGDQMWVECFQDTGGALTTVLNYQQAQQRSETSYFEVTYMGNGTPPGNYTPPAPPVNTNGTAIFGTQAAGTPIFNVGASDLGIPYDRSPFNGDSTSTGFVFGDSFSGSTEGAGTFYHSPVLLYTNTNPDMTTTFNGCYGSGSPRHVDPIVPIVSGEITKIVNDAWMGPIGSVHPKRTFVHYVSVNNWSPNEATSDGTNYSAIAWSDNDGATWTDKAIVWNGDTNSVAQSANMVMAIVDNSAVDGYYYVFRKRWQRDQTTNTQNRGIHLTRYSDILNSTSWQNWYYNGTTWTWTAVNTGPDSTPLFTSTDNIGEISVRIIAGTWVMSYFNATAGAIVTRTASSATSVWTNEKTQVTSGSYPQLYGGAIHPKSKSLSDVTLIVSQWNTSTNDPYHAMQFQVSV